jgi:hypothetical protein
MGAAGLAAAAVAIQSESQQVADQYLSKAIMLYELATQTKQGLYTAWQKTMDSATLYPSTSFYDDLAWAASWLYLASGKTSYLNDAVAYYNKALMEAHSTVNPYFFNYENVLPALHLLLYQATKDPTYRFAAQDFVRAWMTDNKAATGNVFYTRKYLAKVQPGGTLQQTANAAFYVMLAAQENLMGGKFMLYACWARDQIGYMLGDAGRWGNASGLRLCSWDCLSPDVIHCCIVACRQCRLLADQVLAEYVSSTR